MGFFDRRELKACLKFYSPGSQTIPSVVGPPHDMYPGMHAPTDHTMGHVSSGIVQKHRGLRTEIDCVGYSKK